MGLADAMLEIKLKYGSPESLEFTDELMGIMQTTSYIASVQLGEERGVPKNCRLIGDATGMYRRNITTISIAPTGSIAFIAECSHGIEPIFSPSFMRIDERGEEYIFTHPLKDASYFVSAVGHTNSPTWEEQIKLVAVVQQNCDSGISKTINLEENATVQDVMDAYILAWELQCKGITVYRNNSRKMQVLNHLSDEEKNESVEAEELTMNLTPMIEFLKEEQSLEQSCPSGVCTI